jgi:hypothetical protein
LSLLFETWPNLKCHKAVTGMTLEIATLLTK